MLSLRSPEPLAMSCDAPAERVKRPRDDIDPWIVDGCTDEHQRLEILGDSRLVISWINGAWEVQWDEHAKVREGTR